MNFRLGFKYKGISYGWHEKKLYRLPQVIGKRFYGMKEIKPGLISTTICYRCNRDRLTINRLRALTKNIDPVYVDVIEDNDLPF